MAPLLALVIVVVAMISSPARGQCSAGSICYPMREPSTGSTFIYDCGQADTCYVHGATGPSTVDCNMTATYCGADQDNSIDVQYTSYLGSRLPAIANFSKLSQVAHVSCRNSSQCYVSGNAGAVACGNSNCFVNGASSVTCDASPRCLVTGFKDASCGSATTCTLDTLNGSSMAYCKSARSCIVRGSSGSVSINCGSSTQCSVQDYGAGATVVVSCSSTGSCSLSLPRSAPTGANFTFYCTTQQQCSGVTPAPSVTVCYNNLGDSSGPCGAAPTPAPSTLPPVPLTTLPTLTTNAPPLPTSAPMTPPPAPMTSAPTPRPPAPSPSSAPLAPSPTSADPCVGSPPAPNAVCISGSWWLPTVTVSNGDTFTVSQTVQIGGDLVLGDGSTLHITMSSDSAVLLDVSGCLVPNNNATLSLELTSPVGDTRIVNVLTTSCMRGAFAETKVSSHSGCDTYRGKPFYTGAGLSVALQNDQAPCRTQSKYVLMIVIMCVVVVGGAVGCTALYWYRQRELQRRLMARRNPNQSYATLIDK